MKISKILFFTTISFLPLYIIRGATIPTTFLEILIIFTTFIWLVERFFKKDFNLSDFKNQFNFLILLLFIVSLVELLFSLDIKGGLGILRAYFWEPFLVFYLTIWFIKREGAKFLMYAILACSIIVSFVSVIQITTGYLAFAPEELELGRATSFFNSANAVGLLIGPIFVLIFPFLLQFKKDFFHFYSSFAIIISLVAILLTKSRGTYISLLSVLVLYFLIFLFRKFLTSKKALLTLTLFFAFIPIIIVFCFYILLFKFDLTPPVENAVYKGSDTLQIRFYLWEGTSKLIFDHPLFGAGLNGFKNLYSENYILPQYTEPLQYPHNFWLTIYSELGFFGVIIFLVVYYICFKSIFNFFGKNGAKISDEKEFFNSFALPFGLLGALVYIQIHGLVDVPYFKNDLACQFWILVGLVSTLGFSENKKLFL